MVLFTASASPEGISDVKVHMKHFGGEKVLMLMEPQEREDAFFRYENNEMVRLGGYYLYYEKIGMQTYMIDKNEELQPEPQEKYEDQAVKDFRKIIADKETRKGRQLLLFFIWINCMSGNCSTDSGC